ncbi:MAG: VOC family protein [Pirellulaceae bacterium]
MSLKFKFDHLGVAVSDMDAALASYENLFGYRLLSGPFDDPEQEATVAFVGSGEPHDVVIELIAPLTEKSHVQRILDRGVAAYHVCYEVEDIEATLAELKASKCLIVRQPVPAVAYQGRHIAWFYTPTKQLTELVEATGSVA